MLIKLAVRHQKNRGLNPSDLEEEDGRRRGSIPALRGKKARNRHRSIYRDGFDSFWCISRLKSVPVHETVFKEDPDLGTFVLGPAGHRHGIHEQLMSSFFSIPNGNQRCEVYSLRKLLGYGFTTGKPLAPINSDDYPFNMSAEDQLADPNSILNCFKKLANIRKKNPALQANEPVLESYARIPTQNDQWYYASLRFSSKPGQRILVVVNLQDTSQEVICDSVKTKHKIDDIYDMVNLCSGKEEESMRSEKYTVHVPPCGFEILEMKRK